MIPDGDTWEYDGASANPYVAADANGSAKLQSLCADIGITWMVLGQNLDPWPNLREVPNRDFDNVEYDAVVIDAHAVATTASIQNPRMQEISGAGLGQGEVGAHMQHAAAVLSARRTNQEWSYGRGWQARLANV